ncbi:4Fe-4S dicluster domain-containing protein [Saccharopolyspora shandongensis]|uniref:4Fe-4S dicluster domain-containing protein n=1 Tax=Saccharopolyspora shandongensis TaxID=418495 RepID=UPI0034097451
MRVMAQLAMVMNLDKCIGCHTCSVTCKQAWTNRGGVEYVWFNNVETRPGQGYPRTYEDQQRWRGGWRLTRGGRLKLRGGGRFKRLLSLFANPKLPAIQDYYEPWTYDYDNLISAPLSDQTPVARPRSLICPYKKVYFNHRTGKAEKCTLCYPRMEVGLPTVCSETCVGRLRYLGVVLYDADRVLEAASVDDEHQLYPAQLEVLLDPNDPEVLTAAQRAGIPPDWIDAAQRSPIHALIKDFRVALPLHPEFRTMPMVWYIPPLSPVVDKLVETGHDGEDVGNIFGAIDALRIPVEYLAELFTAGDVRPVTESLRKLGAMRSYMRDINLGRPPNPAIPEAAGLDAEQVQRMYRLLALAKYEERYVIPQAHAELAGQLDEPGCSLDYEGGPGMYASGPFGESSGQPVPMSVENFHLLKQRQSAEHFTAPDGSRRVNLLNWDGRGTPEGLFPRNDEDR